MANGTLRGGLADTINELNKLLLHTTDFAEENKIRQLKTIYFHMLEAVIQQTIDNNTPAFRTATAALEQAEKLAIEAQADIAKIAAAISAAANAIKTVDKIVNVGLGLFA